MSPTNSTRYKYMPDEMSKGEFLARFVVRQEIFDELFGDLKEIDYSVPNQHSVIVGQRGQGKTTLLRKLKLEVEQDEELSTFLIPVKFSEEQYRIRRLCRLWEEVAEYLQTYHEEIFGAIYDEIEPHVDEEDYPSKCFSYFEKLLKKSGKKLLLLIDNIDVMLEKFTETEQRRLREILLTSSSFIIIGASTKMLEFQYDYNKPFYEFFKIVRLEALNSDESIAILRMLGDDKQREKIEQIISDTPERIEALRRVTGGVPRTIVMLFDIFIEDNKGAFDDLTRIMDEVTPLYKHRMDDLPAELQEIVDTIALNWDGMMTKEIAKKTGLESKRVSAQLKQLEKYQIVQSESVGKNKIYIIKERFFNIWYLMRHGRKKDRQKVEWLVQFLLSWYDRDELNDKAEDFMDMLQEEEVDAKYVYMMAESFGHVGIDDKVEHKLKKVTSKYLQKIDDELAKELSSSNYIIVQEALKIGKKEGAKKAIKVLEKAKSKSSSIFMSIGDLYGKLSDFKKAEEYYMMAVEQKDIQGYTRLGHLYRGQGQYNKAKECYLKAGKQGIKALLISGHSFVNAEKYDKAEEYYLKAVEQGNTDGLISLGHLYKEQGQYDKAEEYYLKAVEQGNTDGLISLGHFYRMQEKYDKAEKYYLKVDEQGNTHALISLGHLYKEQGQYDKAEEYYLKVVEQGDGKSVSSLLWIYFYHLGKKEKALEVTEKYSQNFKSAAFSIIYLWNEKFTESYEMFMEDLVYDTDLTKLHHYTDYLTLLISKGQYYKAKEFMEMPEYQLKERYKPIWYALMTLMQDDFPIEIKKMGSELKETVDEVLEKIEDMQEKYAID